LVIFVKSRVESFGLRDLIRSTWSNQDYVGDWSVSVMFLVGKTDSTYLNRMLQSEGRDKQDVLIGDFIDSYQNLTLKSISGNFYDIFTNFLFSRYLTMFERFSNNILLRNFPKHLLGYVLYTNFRNSVVRK